MSSALFYVDVLPEAGERVVVDGDEGFHAANVRRIRVGEELDVSDGAGAIGHCVVEDVAKGRLEARLLDRRTVDPSTPTVTVVQALPKSDRAELAVELATEAGADGFIAWQSERCVARWDGAAKVDKGLRRWQAVARSAARQSRRPYIPTANQVLSTGDLIGAVGVAVDSGAVVLALHESATEPLTAPSLTARLEAAAEVILLVGPEGGISDGEIGALARAGATAVRLGPSVLRTSTAAAVALGALGVLTGRWS
jgi:16S rRNA (uracil1498-N3)-methyltransferase